MADPIITKLEIHEYEYTLDNLGRDYNGFNLIYEPGGKAKARGKILRIFTDVGIIGEYAGAQAGRLYAVLIDIVRA